ncbi:MAG: hypothetical protein AAFP86_10110, partial [Planctomycetota bacterium]
MGSGVIIGKVALGAAVSLFALSKLGREEDEEEVNEVPIPPFERGSQIPRLIGRDQITPIFLSELSRREVEEDTGPQGG